MVLATMQAKEEAMIRLTEQQQQELRQVGWPPRILNPCTQETFVLLHTDMYERVRALLEEEDEMATVREMGSLVGRALEEAEKDDSKESA
jgi:hypothetical protein